MKVFLLPDMRAEAEEYLFARRRAGGVSEEALATAGEICERVRTEGFAAVKEYSARFDGFEPRTPEELRIPPQAMAKALDEIPGRLLKALERSIANVRAYHEAQMLRRRGFRLRTSHGVLQEVWRPVDSAGLYVPAGAAPLASTLIMNAVPAQVAGCRRIVATAAPMRGGQVHPVILATAALLRIDELYRIGGAQGVAALAYGAGICEPVDVVAGPGNAYVVAAKMKVWGTVGIDYLSGPSEAVVLADESAQPRLLAVDLLSQAEHTGHEYCVLLTTDERVARETAAEVERRLPSAPRREAIESTMKNGVFCAVVTRSLREACEMLNRIAPEHAEVIVRDERRERRVLSQLRHVGALFVGRYSPIPAGDFTAGTNHVLPTGGAARFSSPLSVDTFMKRTSVARITKTGLAVLTGDIEAMAEAEGLPWHGAAARERFR